VKLITAGQRRRLDQDLEDIAYRVGREAVVNAVRHAEAARIEIEVEFRTESLRLTVRDDGRGLTRAQGEEALRTGHLGLSGIRERTARAGGRCDVTSEPGTGTVVTIEIPLMKVAAN
jgi:signal transduction histidine kinase